MALFGTQKKYEIEREVDEIALRINYETFTHLPSLEDNPQCMAYTIDLLNEVGRVTKLIFFQKQDYEYDGKQTSLVFEIAELYKMLKREDSIIAYGNVAGYQNVNSPEANKRFAEIQDLMHKQLKQDPIGTYVKLTRLYRKEKLALEQLHQGETRHLYLLKKLIELLEGTQMISRVKSYLAGYAVGDRTLYRRLFTPIIKPDFMYTKVMSSYPVEGEELDSYTLPDGTEVTIFDMPGTVQYLYHILPPEFKLSEEKYEILDMARKIMAEHKPKESDFVEPHRMREVFFNVGHDLIEELTRHKNMHLTEKEVTQLTKILVRYTVGFGLIEVLLQDEKIQDISVNSPAGQIPIFIVHGEFDDCKTNILPTLTETESWASKLRMISGRPLDEANPILDTELELPGASVRISTITKPLDPSGLAFSFRRHRDKPWTLPLFMKVKTITPFAAGLLSFLIDGTRTMLICGTRSSGKSSLLSAMLVEIMRRYRIITVEDTLELPTNSLRRLGFNIQPMKVASALSKSTTEMNADDGIRATLRLGDSALIVGEVRSGEAKALYEAMRVGAAANVVAGTIHGDSPYGIYDRVVNDIGVPKTSFKATDICVIVNPIKSADGLHKYRRVTQITEVRKNWDHDPLLEGGFADLMKYDATEDQLKATSELLGGDSEILKSIAANIKEFAGNWDAVWDNINLRAKVKEAQLNIAEKLGNDDLLEAEFTIECNDAFHKISERVKADVGTLDSKMIYFEWENWLNKEVKKSKWQKKQSDVENKKEF